MRNQSLVMEIAEPISLVFCILSLYALFHTAFLNPSSDMQHKIYDSFYRLVLAAAVSLIGGLIFREAEQGSHAGSGRLTATLPVQVFCWAAGSMLVLFVVSWYLETNCIFYRDVRF